jgi:hypothetical protein
MSPYKYNEEIIIKILRSANLGAQMFAGAAFFILTVAKAHKA